ncbi:MAG: RAD55 family ATPase [Candidatus Baldrarchaeia archaeon]
MERVSCGIKEIDEILGGGFPRGSLILLLGDPGAGKFAFCNAFIADGIKRREPCLYVTTEPPEVIRSALEELGINTYQSESDGIFRIVDCHSWLMKEWIPGVLEREKYAIDEFTLPKIDYQVWKARKEIGSGGRTAFYSLTDLFIHIGDRRAIVELIKSLRARTRELKTTMLADLDLKTQESSWTRALMHVCDGIILFRTLEFEDKFLRTFRVIKMPHEHDSHLYCFDLRGQKILNIRRYSGALPQIELP